MSGFCIIFILCIKFSFLNLPGEDTAFLVKAFVKHVAELHSTQGFTAEFEVWEKEHLSTCDSSCHVQKPCAGKQLLDVVPVTKPWCMATASFD